MINYQAFNIRKSFAFIGKQIFLPLLILSYLHARATPAVKVTANDWDTKVINPITAGLGDSVHFASSVTGISNTSVTWTVQGAGTISTAGVYQAPAAIPSNSAVTVICTSSADSSVSSSYALTIVNPIPSTSWISPKTLPEDATTTVTFGGAKFIPGSVVMVGGKAVPTTYQSASSLLAQVPVALHAAGPIPITIHNGTPGGGDSSAFQAPLATASIQVTANDWNTKIVNPTTAGLGDSVHFASSVTGIGDTSVVWSVQGAGTISTAGVYTAPAAIPANPAVTVICTSSADSSVSGSYALTIVNPVPSITWISPKTLPEDATTTVTFGGAQFVPSSVVMVGGSALPTTYQSASSLLAQVPVALHATGPISITVHNPTPGGGNSSAFQAPLATTSIQVTANDWATKVVNPTTAGLGDSVHFASSVTGIGNTSVVWSVQGAGTISTAGVYTVPAAIPANPAVTVICTSSADSSISGSYALTIVNPIPSITWISPKTLPVGATTTVTFGGAQFVPSSVVMVGGKAVPTTYQSASSLLAQVPVALNATGSISTTIHNPTPGGGDSSVFPAPLATGGIQITANDWNSKVVNPTTAGLGDAVHFASSVTGIGNTSVVWSVQGGGTISTAGVYTAPAAIPANPAVKVVCTSSADSSVSGSYALTIVNPIATISWIGPTPPLTSTKNIVTVAGAGFVTGSTASFNGQAVPVTYQSSTRLSITLPATAGDSQATPLVIHNPDPGHSDSAAFSVTLSVPTISSATPSTVAPGAYTLTLSGVNLTPSSTIFLNGTKLSGTYSSSSTVSITGQLAPWRTDTLVIGIGDSQATSPFASVSVPISNPNVGAYDAAARFSFQAAFGPRPDLVTHIQQIGAAAYLNEQFSQPISVYSVPASSTDGTQSPTDFFNNALTGNNLLRQRIAFSLGSFISASVPMHAYMYQMGVPWQLLLEKDAFGNFRSLLTDVAMNSTMGMWLNMGNNWAPTDPTQHPNQNFARELMQLFTMGLNQLNGDGSLVLDSNGNPIPSFDQATVLDLSRALTGWGLPAPTSSNLSLKVSTLVFLCSQTMRNMTMEARLYSALLICRRVRLSNKTEMPLWMRYLISRAFLRSFPNC